MRIGSYQASGVIGAMQIHHQVMVGSLAKQAMIKINHLLIISIHEIHLDAFNTPALVLRQCIIHLRIQCLPVQPYPQAHLAFSGICHQRRHVDVVNGAGHIHTRPHGATTTATDVPTFVD